MFTDRLEELEQKFRRKKHRGAQLLWVTFNPAAAYRYDLADAREDVEWMISEITRLREENASLREGLDALRRQLSSEIDESSAPMSGRNSSETG